MSRRPARLSARLLAMVLAPTFILLLLEAGLRLAGFPSGSFAAILAAARGAYPPGRVTVMDWGPVPYVVATNSLGLRGPEVSFRKPPGTLRILTLGDSITDGFFVDNDDTWQPHLASILTAELGRPVEVINGATGGGSIDKQLAMYRRLGRQLKPDWVVLTFCTNDIGDVHGKSAEELVRSGGDDAAPSPTWLGWFIGRTAIGDAGFSLYLHLRSRAFRHRVRAAGVELGPQRYQIAGGDAFEANAATFRQRYAAADMPLLAETLWVRVQTALDQYGQALAVFADECRRDGVRLVLAYFPAYPQVYEVNPPRYANQRVEALAAKAGIVMLDLTDGFRERGRDRVLHLAPLDFHLNPDGNRVFAAVLGEQLRPLLQESRYHRPMGSHTGAGDE